MVNKNPGEDAGEEDGQDEQQVEIFSTLGVGPQVVIYSSFILSVNTFRDTNPRLVSQAHHFNVNVV